MSVSALASGLYRLTVPANAITDAAGNPLAHAFEWLLLYIGDGASLALPASATTYVADQLAIGEAPDRLRKGAGRYPQPVALLARLGVDAQHEGRGLGAGLLADVIARVPALSAHIGCRGLLVHAESQTARDFHLHLVPEFEQSPTDPLHLVLMTKDIRRTLGL